MAFLFQVALPAELGGGGCATFVVTDGTCTEEDEHNIAVRLTDAQLAGPPPDAPDGVPVAPPTALAIGARGVEFGRALVERLGAEDPVLGAALEALGGKVATGEKLGGFPAYVQSGDPQAALVCQIDFDTISVDEPWSDLGLAGVFYVFRDGDTLHAGWQAPDRVATESVSRSRWRSAPRCSTIDPQQRGSFQGQVMAGLIRACAAMAFLLVVGCGEVSPRAIDAAGGSDGAIATDGAIDSPIAIDASIDSVGASCGDGVVNGADVCDDGANNGMYGFCNATCTALGPRCSDGVVNGPEACDNGTNNGTYGFCNATCTALGPRCGDGVMNGPETCDSGTNNGMYGFCNATCTAVGPRCGDGVTNGPEACDSGANNGSYGFCNNACTALGPRCGDTVINGPEVCDAGTVYSSTMAAGVCRPDCAGSVQQRSIGITANRVAPNPGGVAGADAVCRTDLGTAYRALVVDGSTRIASTTAYSGSGQVGWVVQPYTRYVSAETGLLVFITDHTRLLGAANGVGVNLYNPIRSTDDGWGAWTGANPGWTSGADCADWSSILSTVNGLSCNATATSSTSFPNNGAMSNCAQLRRFFCVQQ